MRSVIGFVMTTVDGYFEGPNGELDWHNVDDEFNEFSLRQLDECDTLVFGRITYQMMAAFWPTPAGVEADPETAARMNDTPKIAVSRTLDRADWANTRIVGEEALEAEFTQLKEAPGRDILILGSSDLTASLIRLGLVDELRVMVAPLTLGAGRPLFTTAPGRIGLELLTTRPFTNGNVLLCYRPGEL